MVLSFVILCFTVIKDRKVLKQFSWKGENFYANLLEYILNDVMGVKSKIPQIQGGKKYETKNELSSKRTPMNKRGEGSKNRWK